ncbi:MAG: hypothetical protein DWQ06_14965 [Calditrichaeota bacterium]|nr:MAG: hypothetical protein DWQ06_14965 [Calditrichota bacterium]
MKKHFENIFPKETYISELKQINSFSYVSKAFIVVIGSILISKFNSLQMTPKSIVNVFISTMIIAFFLVSLLYLYFNLIHKKFIVKNYNKDIFTKESFIYKKLLCKNVTKSKSYYGDAGNLYFGDFGFVYNSFTKKKLQNIMLVPLFEIKIELVEPKLDFITRWTHKKFIRKNLRIYTKSSSQIFQVPNPEETLKKLEAIKQELLSQQDSSSDGNA